MTNVELSTHRIAILAVIATFVVAGWLLLKIMLKFEPDFPVRDDRIGTFVLGLLFSFIVLVCIAVDYFMRGRGHYYLYILKGCFAVVSIVLFTDSIFVIDCAMQAFIPNREGVGNILTGLIVLGIFISLSWSLTQIFGD